MRAGSEAVERPTDVPGEQGSSSISSHAVASHRATHLLSQSRDVAVGGKLKVDNQEPRLSVVLGRVVLPDPIWVLRGVEDQFNVGQYSVALACTITGS